MQKLQMDLTRNGDELDSKNDHQTFHNRSKWHQSSRVYVSLLGLLASLVLLLLVLLMLSNAHLFKYQNFWISDKRENTSGAPNWLRSQSPPRALCLTRDCVESAAFLLQRIDFQADPCTNFYEFACGGFLRTRSVPDDHLSRNILQEIQDEIYVEMKALLEKKDNKIKCEKGTECEKIAGTEAVRKARLFYRSCMNESTVNDEPAALKVLIKLLETDGLSWQLLDQVREKSLHITNEMLEKRMFQVFLHQIQPIIHFYVAPEELKSNSKEYALHVYSGTTVLESAHLLNETNNHTLTAEHRSAYAKLQVDILSRILHIREEKGNMDQANALIQRVIDFEVDLARITKNFSESSSVQWEEVNSTDGDGAGAAHVGDSGAKSPSLNAQSSSTRKVHYERIKPDELQNTHPFLNWTSLLSRMQQTGASPVKQLLVESSEYLGQISRLVEQHTPKVVDDYLCWATVARFLPYLGAHFRHLYADFRRKVPDLQQPADPPLELIASNIISRKTFNWKIRRSSGSSNRLFLSRWKECVHLTAEGLKRAAAVVYVRDRVQHVHRVAEHVQGMVERIQQAFTSIVDKQTWIEPEAKARIKERALQIRSKIALPAQLLESADEQLIDLRLREEDVFIANIVAMLKHEMLGELKRLNETPDLEKDWFMEPLVPNAYYDSLNHFIILPVAILRKPLIGFFRPPYLDYATLGVVIGHEIAHAFDSGTRKELLAQQHTYSTSDSLDQLPWWPKQVNVEYEERSKCFASQFSNYSIDGLNEKLNGNLTLEENICDFAGFQQAFTAYRTTQASQEQVLLPGLGEFSADQLFFLQYAQVWCEISNKEGLQKSLSDSHAPGRYRANGVVSNAPQYAAAFKCASGTPMNPVDKCELWTAP